MTEAEYKEAMRQLIKAVIVGVILIYGFFILAFVFDIH